ncbi:MAG: diguanylate cyclase [Desulfovibrio sp.]|jgi:diguanylate cyclase (GGDEF)-like protein|nr:diguanylate cyclase [Desulfovibrio sp.]
MDKLISNAEPPPLPSELADDEEAQNLHNKLLALRKHMVLIFKGNLSQDITERGYIAGLLKSHLANLRHLTWQVEQVAKGDFSQRVDFMGDFSEAFNHMASQLDVTLKELKETEEALRNLTGSLSQEVRARTVAVHNLKQSEARFKYLAEHDPLTNALNRRSFFNLVESEFKAARIKNAPCCIAMLDIDFFKKINDIHGHNIGDLALKHVVSLSSASLRHADRMGRYGGEEFLFFFADADLEQGTRAAERIRKSIAENRMKLPSGKLPMTVSLGVSIVLPEWPGERDNAFLQQIVAMADAALYQAKQSGRNRVCAAPIAPPAPETVVANKK